jgi:hypothetical protein
MPESSTDKRNSRALYAGVALLVMALGLGSSWQIARLASGIDYLHIWSLAGWNRLTPTFSDIYDRQRHADIVGELQQVADDWQSPRLNEWLQRNRLLYPTGFHPTGTPWFYSANRWSSGGWPGWGPDAGYRVFQTVSILVFAVGCVWLGISCGMRWWQALWLTGLLLILHRGLHSDAGVANVNRLQCGWFGISIGIFRGFLPRAPLVACLVWGGLLGLLAMYKPNAGLAVLLPAAALLIDGLWRPWGVFVAGIAAGVAAGLLATPGGQPLDTWLAWRGYAASIADQPFALMAGNYSLPRLLPDPWVGPFSLGLTLLLVAAVIWQIIRTRPADRGAFAEALGSRYVILAGTGLLLPLICAPVAWGHYMVLGIPLAIMLIALPLNPSGTSGNTRTAGGIRLAGIAGLLLCGWVPLSLLPGIPAEVVLLSIQLGLCLLLASAWRALEVC